MKKNILKYRKTFAVTAIIILICSYICVSIINPMTIIRGGEESVRYLGDGCVITQQLEFLNSKNLHISLLRGGIKEVNDQNARIKVSLIQGDVESSTDIYVKDLENRWMLVKLDLEYNKFKDGDITFVLEGIGVTPEYPVDILFTGGVQNLDLDYATYNGEIQEGLYCCVSWDYFSLTLFLKFTALFAAIAAVIIMIIKLLTKYKKNIQDYWVIATYLIVLLVRYIMYISNTTLTRELDQWMTTPWLINYADGFVSKALPGTIYSIFSDFISMKSLNIVFHLIFVIAVLVSIFVMKRLIDMAKNLKYDKIMNAILVWYAVGPASLAVYYRQWGRMDVILTICFLLSIYALINGRKYWLYAITIFSSFAILSHQMYVFLMYPAIFGIFAYCVFINKDKKYRIPMVINLIIPACLAFYVQFVGNIDIPLAEYMQMLMSRTDMGVLETMVSGEYYIQAYENIYLFGRQGANLERQPIATGILVLLLLPLIFKLYNALYISAKAEKKNKLNFMVILYLAIVPLISLFIFFTISDHGRVVTLVICQITFMVAALLCIGGKKFEESVVITEKNFESDYGKNYIMGFAIYLSVIGTNAVIPIPEITTPLINIYDKLIQLWL